MKQHPDAPAFIRGPSHDSARQYLKAQSIKAGTQNTAATAPHTARAKYALNGALLLIGVIALTQFSSSPDTGPLHATQRPDGPRTAER